MNHSLLSVCPKLTARRRTRLATTLPVLQEAIEDAREIGVDPWQCALSARELIETGLTGTDLRWLVGLGYLLHAEEITIGNDACRVFRSICSLAINATTCFLLTPQGNAFCDELLGVVECGLSNVMAVQPHWDAAHRTLMWNGLLVKRFRTPATNQEVILQAFEEEGWPPRIDDPLPGVVELDPKVRLHDAIKRLNRSRLCQRLRFCGDGTGDGVRWEIGW
jgi:hypothetical protein